MSRVQWDQDNEKIYELGLDRGVLYLVDQHGVAWNGLTSVDDDSETSTAAFFFDGSKYMTGQSTDSYRGKIKAFTYPDEFSGYSGFEETDSGLYFNNQKYNSFCLSFRTLIGDNIVGQSLGYKIHILYNLSARPAAIKHETLQSDVEPINFEWALSSRPVELDGYKPTAYIIADSRYLTEEMLQQLEDLLYGTDEIDPWLPSLPSLIEMLTGHYTIIITDYGNGIWSAEGPDELIVAMDEGDFKILGSNAVYLDEYTYTISSS